MAAHAVPLACAGCVEVPLAWLLEYVSPPWGASWDEMFAELDECPFDRATLELLGAELARDGRFHTPVEVDAASLVLLNGRHRVRCAAAAGSASVVVRFSAVDDLQPRSRRALKVVFALAEDVVVSPPLTARDVWFGSDDDGELFHQLACCVRSFPLPPGGWVECGSLSWVGGHPVGVFEAPVGVSLSLAEFSAAVDGHLADTGVAAKVASVRHYAPRVP